MIVKFWNPQSNPKPRIFEIKWEPEFQIVYAPLHWERNIVDEYKFLREQSDYDMFEIQLERKSHMKEELETWNRINKKKFKELSKGFFVQLKQLDFFKPE